jgi:hypothetical protein
MEDSQIRQEAAVVLAKNSVYIDPDTAIEWVKTIDDPAVRGRALYEVTAEWLEADKVAAAEASLTVDIPEPWREKIAKRLAREE